jgi:hypothetical protein
MSESDKIASATGETYPDAGTQGSLINQQFPGGPVPYGTKTAKSLSRETTAGEWLTQITMCDKAYQESFVAAKKNLNHYMNKYGTEQITVPLLAPMIEIKSSLATFRDPYISVRPRRKAIPTSPEEVMSCAIKETYINWLWHSLDLKREVRRAVRDTLLLTGRGIITPGYNVVVDPEKVITHDSVIAYRTSPFDYYLDIEADSSSNAFYGIRRMIMPIWQAEEIFKKKGVFQEIRYSKWARFKQETNKPSQSSIRRFARTVVYEIQDLTTNKFYFVTPSYTDFLEKFDNPYPIDGLIPEFLEPMPIPDEIFCMPEASMIRPQLDELNKLRNMWLEIWRRQIPKYLVEKGAAVEADLEKLIGSEVASFTFVGDKEGISLLPNHSGTADMQYHEMRVKEDISEITGWNQYMQGQPSSGRKTAYEVSEIVAGGNIRITDLNDSVEQFCSRIARKMLVIASSFVGVEEMQQIVGLPADLAQVGLPPGFSIGESTIREDTEVTILAESMQPPGKSQDMQKAMLLQNFLAFPEVNRWSVLNEMARLMDLNPTQIFVDQSQVDPRAQQMQMEAQMGGRGREAGGAMTGGIMGSRMRPELVAPR